MLNSNDKAGMVRYFVDLRGQSNLANIRIRRRYLFSIREDGSVLALSSIFGSIWILSISTWVYEPYFSVANLGLIQLVI